MKDFTEINNEYQKVAGELMNLYIKQMMIQALPEDVYEKEEELLYSLRLLARAKILFDMQDLNTGVQ